MRLLHLHLSNYRNLRRVDLDVPTGTSVVVADNAQGKSNLFEAVYLLATMRAVRAETELQLVNRESLDDVMPTARVAAQVETSAGTIKLEVVLVARPATHGHVVSKSVRVNGVPKRLSDAVGRLAAVLFTAEDMEMISGPPSLRRRYMDMTLTQVDPLYGRARARFEKVLVQRNHLLKRIREGLAGADEAVFWDAELAKAGAYIFRARARSLDSIARLAAEAHRELAPGEELRLRYEPRVEEANTDVVSASLEEVTSTYARALGAGLSRDTAAGMTLLGPHRDDLVITLNELPASGYASRAQQRTITLSLRLAEARFLSRLKGEPPVLLLDDVLSEMDSSRRESVLAALSYVDQILISGTDKDRFPERVLGDAAFFVIEKGEVRPLVGGLSALRREDS
jgi:DNA replication and repair protein RecF